MVGNRSGDTNQSRHCYSSCGPWFSRQALICPAGPGSSCRALICPAGPDSSWGANACTTVPWSIPQGPDSSPETRNKSILTTFFRWVHVKYGTPAGGLISPMLFACFVNDLPGVIQAEMLMFTDDMKLYTVCSCRWKDRQQGCGAVTFLVGSGSGSGSGEAFRLRLRLRLRVKLFGGSGSGSGSG